MIDENITENHLGKMTKLELITKLEEKIIKPIGVSQEKFKGPAKHSQLRSILEHMEHDWN